MSKSDQKGNRARPRTLDELERRSVVMQDEAPEFGPTDYECPVCDTQLQVVGLHWVQTPSGEDGCPEAHVHMACRCGYEDCGGPYGDLPEPLPEPLWLGAMGAELALARMLGYQDYDPDEDPPGMVRGLHVVWSAFRDVPLLVHEEDEDDAIVVQVTGTFPYYRPWGWLRAGEAREVRYPQLNAMRDLPQSCGRREAPAACPRDRGAGELSDDEQSDPITSHADEASPQQARLCSSGSKTRWPASTVAPRSSRRPPR